MLNSGMLLEDILDMTFDQIKLCAKCVYNHKVDMVTMILEPIGAAFGSKKAKRSMAKKSRKHKPKHKRDKAVEEELKFAQLNSLGIDIS